MKVCHLSLIVFVDASRNSNHLTEDRGKHCKVSLEVCLELIEVSHTTSDCLPDLLVSLNWVLLLFNSAVELEQLEVRLSVACFGSLEKADLGLVEVGGNTETFLVEDTEPVSSDQTPLF